LKGRQFRLSSFTKPVSTNIATAFQQNNPTKHRTHVGERRADERGTSLTVENAHVSAKVITGEPRNPVSRRIGLPSFTSTEIPFHNGNRRYANLVEVEAPSLSPLPRLKAFYGRRFANARCTGYD